ncbi:MAG: isocitrate lyase/PEP mutase family protein [Smithella sp.]|nr:isocitrate lyase/PEP mutase family protein [Smithella sp.]
MTAKTIRQLLKEKKPLQLVAAHDALSARLIEQAGFRAYSVGGFAVAGVRYGLPDVGVTSFGELASGVRDIMRGSDLPVIIDGDDGYGDVKNITRTVEVYEDMGVAGIVFEDQTNPKRCGHMAGKEVVSLDQIKRKLQAALAARKNPDTFIIGRTDSRAVHGLDDAINRAKQFVEVGVDGVFVEAPFSLEELKKIGSSIKTPLVVNMAAGGHTPLLPPDELAQMGFSIIIYAGTLLFRATKAMQETLKAIKVGVKEPPDYMVDFQEMTGIFGLPKWVEIENKFGNKS